MSDSVPTTDLSDTDSNVAPDAEPDAEPEATLRNAPLSLTLFWDKSYPKHLLCAMRDKAAFGTFRDLLENELMAMALNEVAAQRGRGYFFHLRNRDSRKKAPGAVSAAAMATDGELIPASRIPPTTVCADFPSLVYMKFVWDQQTQSAFLSSSHRSRFLKSDGQINLPHATTPLYGIQYAANSRYPLYATTSPSLIVIATPATLSIASTRELEGLIGRWPSSKKRPVGPSPDMRLDTASYLWPGASQRVTLNSREQRILQTIQSQFSSGNVEVLYEQIVARCVTGDMAPNLTADQLRDMMPRPQQPEPGIPLGNPLQTSQSSVTESLNLPSRRGGRLSRKTQSRAHKRNKAEANLDSEARHGLDHEDTGTDKKS